MAEEKKDELIHLTIDGIPIAVPPGTLVWAAAQQAGIEVPIYCYHPKMAPLGACRSTDLSQSSRRGSGRRR